MIPERPGPGGPSGGHLSFLALDGLRLGGLPQPGEQDHLQACPSCASQVQAAGAALPIPPWLADATGVAGVTGVADVVTPHKPARPRRSRHWLPISLLAAVGAAGAMVLLVRGSGPGALPGAPAAGTESETVRQKGANPATRLFIKRGDELWIWDGQTPIRPGDSLRLEIQNGGLPWVSVASLAGAGQPPAVLHQGRLSSDADGLLPVSFRVDSQGRREVISVILSQRPVPAARHAGATPADAEPGTWRQVLSLQKELAP